MTLPVGVAVELFEIINDYCEEIDEGSVSITDKLGKNHSLLYFSSLFLEQFSATHCKQKIVGLNDRSSRQLNAERRRLRSRSEQPASQRLIFQLQKFCTQAGEVSYSTSDTDAEELHLQYFPLLLERIVDWLNEADAERSTRNAARTALTNYNEAVGL